MSTFNAELGESSSVLAVCYSATECLLVVVPNCAKPYARGAASPIDDAMRADARDFADSVEGSSRLRPEW